MCGGGGGEGCSVNPGFKMAHSGAQRHPLDLGLIENGEATPTHVNIMVLASHLGNRDGVPSLCAFVPPHVDKKQISTLLGAVLRRRELQETNRARSTPLSLPWPQAPQ